MPFLLADYRIQKQFKHSELCMSRGNFIQKLYNSSKLWPGSHSQLNIHSGLGKNVSQIKGNYEENTLSW